MTTPVAYKGLKDAAEAVGVDERTLRRAMANTDPSVYPPPLLPTGRHGKKGSFAFTARRLEEWAESLSVFLT